MLYPEILLPIVRVAVGVWNKFQSVKFTNHGIISGKQRSISEKQIERAINTAQKRGSVSIKKGKYGTPQKHYVGSNGITVVIETEGRNAGKIITVWRNAP